MCEPSYDDGFPMIRWICEGGRTAPAQPSRIVGPMGRQLMQEPNRRFREADGTSAGDYLCCDLLYVRRWVDLLFIDALLSPPESSGLGLVDVSSGYRRVPTPQQCSGSARQVKSRSRP